MVCTDGSGSKEGVRKSQNLRGSELLSSKKSWSWEEPQKKAFQGVKDELTKPRVLGLYDPKAPTKIAADASSKGLGAVLLQKNKDNQWKPIAYASRIMSEVETRYAQIEKEALAITWSCEKFAEYILGMRIDIETDHKPLVPLLSTKQLDALPLRVLRFRLRMDRFDFTIHHVPGKEMYTADTLSRAAVAPPGRVSRAFEEELEAFVESLVADLNKRNYMQTIRRSTKQPGVQSNQVKDWYSHQSS